MNKVLFVQFTDPGRYPPLQHAARILLRHGFAVEFVGSALDDGQPTPLPPDLAPLARYWNEQRVGWVNRLNYLLFCLRVALLALRQRALVYGSDPLSTPLLYGLARCGLVVLYHEHDSPPDTAGTRFQRIVAAARRWLLDHVVSVFPSHGRQQAAAPRQRSFLVWNCPALQEVRAIPRLPASARPLRLYFHGSINALRLPLSLIEAMAQCGEAVELWIAGYETQGSYGYLEELRARAQALGVDGRLRLLGAHARDQLWAYCAEADVGICFYGMDRGGDINMRHMAGASNKPFDYLSQGMALLFDDVPQWRQLLAEQYGWACDPTQPAELAKIIDQMSQDRALVLAKGERGRLRVLAEWNYEQQFAPLLNHLRS